MMYLRWALLAPISLLANIFAWITSPFWAAWAATRAEHALPPPFDMIHTHDNSVFGLDFTGKDVPATWGERFANASWWIRRNPCYGWDAHVLGFKSSEVVDQVTSMSGQFSTGKAALRIDKMRLTGDRMRFSYRRDIPLWGGRYCKIWFGHHYFDQANYRMLKFDINPFKKAG